MSNRILMQGNRACVEGALYAGMRFYSGYPITPSTEIAEISAQRLPLLGGRFIQMEDEISGIAAAIGASAAGVKSMTATSGPGFSFRCITAAMTEVPCHRQCHASVLPRVFRPQFTGGYYAGSIRLMEIIQ